MNSNDKYYKQKYLKYKNKYLTLKQLGGEISYECPPDYIKCDKNTKNYELCVHSDEEHICNDEDYDDTKVKVPQINLQKLTPKEREDYEREELNAIRKGYISDNLTKNKYYIESILLPENKRPKTKSGEIMEPKYYEDIKDKYELFVSDHFSVYAYLKN